MVFVLILLCAGWAFAQDDTRSFGTLKARANGAEIRKIDEKVVVANLYKPVSSVKLTNLDSKDREVILKVTNIDPARYDVKTSAGAVAEKGKRHVAIRMSLEAGATHGAEISPRLDNPGKFTFAVLGDSRNNPVIHRAILDRIQRTEAIFAINLGDIVNHGYEQEYVQFTKEIADFGLPYFVVPGNHEVAVRGGMSRFLKFVNPADYSFDLGRFRFVLLDNAYGQIGQDRFRWLESQLAGKGGKFVFMHAPPFSPFSKHHDHVMASPAEVRQFMGMMKKHGVSAVFAGHIHAYGKKNRDGVEYIISGCSGAFPHLLSHEGGFYHYVLVHVDGDKYFTEVFKVLPPFK